MISKDIFLITLFIIFSLASAKQYGSWELLWASETNENIESFNKNYEPFARYGHSSAFYKGDIYISHGVKIQNNSLKYLNDVWRFSTSETKWYRVEVVEDVPKERIENSYFLARNVSMLYLQTDNKKPSNIPHQDLMCIFGGEVSVSQSESEKRRKLGDLWCFSFEEKRWYLLWGKKFYDENISSQGNSPPPLVSHCSVYHQGKIFSFGGLITKKKRNGKLEDSETNSLFEYSLETQKWSEKIRKKGQKWPSPRFAHSCNVNENGKIIIFGGKNKRGDVFDEVWIYDIQKNSFKVHSTSRPKNSQKSSEEKSKDKNGGDVGRRYEHTSTVFGDYFLVFGGSLCDHNVNCNLDNDMWLLNVTSLVWQKVFHPNKGYWPSKRYKHSLVADNYFKNFYLFGGQSLSPHRDFNDVWRFSLDKDDSAKAAENFYLFLFEVFIFVVVGSLFLIFYFIKNKWRVIVSNFKTVKNVEFVQSDEEEVFDN